MEHVGRSHCTHNVVASAGGASAGAAASAASEASAAATCPPRPRLVFLEGAVAGAGLGDGKGCVWERVKGERVKGQAFKGWDCSG